MKRGLIWSDAPGGVFLFGPGHTQQVLTKAAMFPESVATTIPKEWGPGSRLTGGLLWLTGETHRQHRRVITPLYHQKRVHGYRDQIARIVGSTLERWHAAGEVEMMRDSGLMLIEFQNDLVLGLGNVGPEFSGLGERLIEFFGLISHPGVQAIPYNLPFTPRRKLMNVSNALALELERLITAKRAATVENTDIVSMLVKGRTEDGLELTPAELVSESLHLFVAGWVSTRSAVALLAFLVAQHPKVARDLYDELSSELHGETPTLEQLPKLKLLDRVLKEGLRLFPTVPFVSRAAYNPIELSGYHLPPRTELYLSLFHSHRDPEIFPEPLKFKPERWETATPDQYEYLPFGIGTRNCPGMAIANLQMKLLFATLLQRYRLEMPRRSRLTVSGLGVLSPRPDIRLRIVKQDCKFERSRGSVRGNVTRMVDLRD
jgi:cytochrome P450